MVVRRTPPETNRRTRGRPLLWLLTGLIIFAMLVGLLLALDWIDPQGSRLLLPTRQFYGFASRLRSAPFSLVRGGHPENALKRVTLPCLPPFFGR